MKLCNCLFNKNNIPENEERNFYTEDNKLNASNITLESDDSILNIHKRKTYYKEHDESPNYIAVKNITHFPTIEEADENSISSLGSNGTSMNLRLKHLQPSTDSLREVYNDDGCVINETNSYEISKETHTDFENMLNSACIIENNEVILMILK